MNILYLIGNGFDLANHFDTSFLSFYESLDDYINEHKDMQYIKELNDLNALIKKAKEQYNYEQWVDFESFLGCVSDDYTNADEFVRAIKGSIHAFRTFIEKINEKINNFEIDEEYLKVFSLGINKCLTSELTNGKKQKVTRIIKKETSFYNIDFVSFNYTSLLDKLISLRNSKEVNSSVYIPMYNKQTSFNTPFHIHGKLEDGEPTILGVDDIDQVRNVDFKKNSNVIKNLVKPYMNERADNLKNQQLNAKIENADIICIYGMSIGLTDLTWWKKIGSWISNPNAKDRRLIINKYIENTNNDYGIIGSEKDDIIEEEVEKFIAKADIKDEYKDEAKSKIYVSINDASLNILKNN